MQLQFTALGDDEESLPAMSPFAMRNEGKVFNRSDTRGSGVVESLPSQRAPQAFVAPAVPEERAAYVPTQAPVAPPVVVTETYAPVECATRALARPLSEYLLYALLIANGLTLILCVVIATRKK
jgi:hypothetical protein